MGKSVKFRKAALFLLTTNAMSEKKKKITYSLQLLHKFNDVHLFQKRNPIFMYFFLDDSLTLILRSHTHIQRSLHV